MSFRREAAVGAEEKFMKGFLRRKLLGKQLEEQDVLKEKVVKEQWEFTEVSLPEVAGHICDDVLKVQGRKDLEKGPEIELNVFFQFSRSIDMSVTRSTVD